MLTLHCYKVNSKVDIQSEINLWQSEDTGADAGIPPCSSTLLHDSVAAPPTWQNDKIMDKGREEFTNIFEHCYCVEYILEIKKRLKLLSLFDV